MKRTSYILGLTVAFCMGCMATLLIGSTNIKKDKLGQSEMLYKVTPIEVPQSAYFAGSKIDLRRQDRHERMDRELMAFSFMHSTTLQIIKKANRYFPVIEPILKKQGVPEDFKYLMVIESSLNPKAKSGVGAAGLWQFMPQTGKRYGLEVNANIDERYHIKKATIAACKYLKEAYEKYGDWITVAASYNAGQARISNQLQKQLADNALDLWLVEETSRYMFRLMAVKEVLSHPQRFGFMLTSEQLYPPITYHYIPVDYQIDDLYLFAKKQGITYAALKEANLWLRDSFLQNKSHRHYEVAIPNKEDLYYNPKKTKAYRPEWVIDR